MEVEIPNHREESFSNSDVPACSGEGLQSNTVFFFLVPLLEIRTDPLIPVFPKEGCSSMHRNQLYPYHIHMRVVSQSMYMVFNSTLTKIVPPVALSHFEVSIFVANLLCFVLDINARILSGALNFHILFHLGSYILFSPFNHL